MTTFPKAPIMRAPHTFADNGRQVTRAHARLDEVESVQSKQTSDIATNSTNTATAQTTANTAQTTANTATTTLTALDTRLGGSGQETFLGTLVQANSPGTQSHTGVGTITGTPTDTEFNAVNTTTNNMADLLNALIGRLVASNILT